MKELTLELLRNGGQVERLNNEPRPRLKTGRTVFVELPSPTPSDFRKKPERK